MSTVRILTETEDTVTIAREDWLELLAALDDAEDRAAVAERRAKERMFGKETQRDSYLTGTEALRLLDGENPLKVWREKRGLSQRALAVEAKIGNSYLAEIEAERKPGSDAAYRKLGATLQVPPEELSARRYRMRRPNYGPVLVSWSLDTPGAAPGNRAAAIKREEFATVEAALKHVQQEWKWLRFRAASVIDVDQWTIYDLEELYREMER
ncbi:MAG TPA: helix-turn-helix transcriptional regulator [Stellaceae bacterium]|nr:helix-turn-helix transcriptional regulator [Stellaceae bacterium]